MGQKGFAAIDKKSCQWCNDRVLDAEVELNAENENWKRLSETFRLVMETVG
jgi:hypothetical protein